MISQPPFASWTTNSIVLATYGPPFFEPFILLLVATPSALFEETRQHPPILPFLYCPPAKKGNCIQKLRNNIIVSDSAPDIFPPSLLRRRRKTVIKIGVNPLEKSRKNRETNYRPPPRDYPVLLPTDAQTLHLVQTLHDILWSRE